MFRTVQKDAGDVITVFSTESTRADTSFTTDVLRGVVFDEQRMSYQTYELTTDGSNKFLVFSTVGLRAVAHTFCMLWFCSSCPCR